MSAAKPETPLPWTKGPHKDAHVYGPNMCNLYTLADNLPAFAEKVTRLDANYIVRACNAYPELVAALRQAVACIRKQDEHLTAHGFGLNLSSVPGFEGQPFPDYCAALLAKLGEGA